MAMFPNTLLGVNTALNKVDVLIFNTTEMLVSIMLNMALVSQ